LGVLFDRLLYIVTKGKTV